MRKALEVSNEHEVAARANGWAVVDCDPSDDRHDDNPCLYHADLDRVWSLGDWKGALADIGVEIAELNTSVSA